MNQDILKKTAFLIQKRYLKNQNATLRQVYDLDECFTSPHPEEVDFTYNNREEISTILQIPEYFDQLVKLFHENTIRFTLEHNQFIPLTPTGIQHLQLLYRDYVTQFCNFLQHETSYLTFRKRYQSMLVKHFDNLHLQLNEITPEQTRPAVFNINVVCAEYDPPLQLKILNIIPSQLKQPVLDIGCGMEANLVGYLNDLGIQCFGIDQYCKTTKCTQTIDWFSYAPQPNSWGTIISHMAFSHHFRFNHLNPYGNPKQYALKYKQYLNALQTGGSFYYTPQLPFIEQFLHPSDYQILSIPVPNQTNFFVTHILKKG